jgi:hypothetical protein
VRLRQSKSRAMNPAFVFYGLSCSAIHSAIAVDSAAPLCFRFSSPNADFERCPRYGRLRCLPLVADSTNKESGQPSLTRLA